MKYKIICLIVVLLMGISAIAFQNFDLNHDRQYRYYQHKEAQKKSKCQDHGDDVFCTHLPLISVLTDEPMPYPYIQAENGDALRNEYGNRLQNQEMVSAKIEYFDNEFKNNHLTDIPTVSEKALIRIRGASSRSFDKKSYFFKLKESNLIDNKDRSLSGMTADNEWILHGPFLDKTLIRNYLCYNLAGEFMEYSPNVRFCELFLNGEYQGVYVLTEKIEYNDKGRINITETDPNMTKTSYIVLIDRGQADPRYLIDTFAMYNNITGTKDLGVGQYEIIYPSRTLTEEQRDFIENDISKFEKSLYSYDYNDRKLGYPNYIDIQSFVDYFIITEFTLNYDALELSTFLYKDIRGKYKMVVWDFNSVFDNYQQIVLEPNTFLSHHKFWYLYLFKDQHFTDEVVKRYRELRRTILSDEYILDCIDETIAYLGPAIERNYVKWGYSFEESFDMLQPKERNSRNYDQAVQQLKDSIIERGKYMDENIELLYSLSHASINKKYNHSMEP